MSTSLTYVYNLSSDPILSSFLLKFWVDKNTEESVFYTDWKMH